MSGEVVVITGAQAGVGREVARLFAQGGARIGLIDDDAGLLQAVGREVEALGGQALILPFDVDDADAVETAAFAVEEHFGAIEIWVNADIHGVEDYLGAVHGTFSALHRMRPRHEGSIVQVALGARRAVDGFTDALRNELLHAGSGVRISAVHVDNAARIVDVARHPRRAFLVRELFHERPSPPARAARVSRRWTMSPPAPSSTGAGSALVRAAQSRATRIAALSLVLVGLLVVRRLIR